MLQIQMGFAPDKIYAEIFHPYVFDWNYRIHLFWFVKMIMMMIKKIVSKIMMPMFR